MSTNGMSLLQFQSVCLTKMSKALEMTMDKALDELQKYITEEVYESYSPLWYDRTFELLNNWEYTKSKIKEGWMESTLSFNKPITHSGYPLWQHGISEVSNESLASIVNDGTIGDICNFPQIGARPFWNKFEQWVNTNFERTFMDNCIKLGLPISYNYGFSYIY